MAVEMCSYKALEHQHPIPIHFNTPKRTHLNILRTHIAQEPLRRGSPVGRLLLGSMAGMTGGNDLRGVGSSSYRRRRGGIGRSLGGV